VFSDPEAIFSKVDIPKEHQAVLIETIRIKIASNPMKIRVDFALTCTSFDGIDVIREALLTAKHQVNDNDWKLDFKMIAPPNYQVELQTHAKAEGEAKLKEALSIIKAVMKKRGGHFKQKSDPTVVNAK
jgi:translation initiation factor 2 subunit 1